MAKKWTRSAAFRFYNADPRNINWSWSARSSDGKTVVVTLWKDELKGAAGNMAYDRGNMRDWHNGPGRRFFFEDLAWALANCDGLLRVIVAVRDHNQARRTRKAEWYPQKNLVMRIVHLDPAVGAFRLQQVATTVRAVNHVEDQPPVSPA